MGKYKYINTSRPVRLDILIMSTDIRRSDIIQIFDTEGGFIARGSWNKDYILDRAECWGIATKADNSNTVSFKLLEETRHE